MIFVTVGDNLPFERLVRVVDQWAFFNGRSDVFAQIGDTDWKPTHVAYCKFLEPDDFSRRVASATTIISHAGMGTILSALRAEKPILVMPRLFALGEIRNEHQLATARRLFEITKISVAFNDAELREMLGRLNEVQATKRIDAFAGEELVSTLREFIARS